MVAETPIYIVDEIGKIVQRVSDKLTPQLTAYDANIQGVFYEYGPGKEILETLKQKDEAAEFRDKKYPLVALLMPFEEDRTPGIGVYAQTGLKLVICYHTLPEYKTSDRYEKSFKPVLYPIYMEFMAQLKAAGIVFSVNGEIQHKKTDFPYYGREDKNVGNDFLDAIEINDLELRLYQYECFTEGNNIIKTL